MNDVSKNPIDELVRQGRQMWPYPSLFGACHITLTPSHLHSRTSGSPSDDMQRAHSRLRQEPVLAVPTRNGLIAQVIVRMDESLAANNLRMMSFLQTDETKRRTSAVFAVYDPALKGVYGEKVGERALGLLEFAGWYGLVPDHIDQILVYTATEDPKKMPDWTREVISKALSRRASHLIYDEVGMSWDQDVEKGSLVGFGGNSGKPPLMGDPWSSPANGRADLSRIAVVVTAEDAARAGVSMPSDRVIASRDFVYLNIMKDTVSPIAFFARGEAMIYPPGGEAMADMIIETARVMTAGRVDIPKEDARILARHLDKAPLYPPREAFIREHLSELILDDKRRGDVERIRAYANPLADACDVWLDMVFNGDLWAYQGLEWQEDREEIYRAAYDAGVDEYVKVLLDGKITSSEIMKQDLRPRWQTAS